MSVHKTVERPSITTVRCVRCGHTILEHGAEGDRPDINPDFMVCEVDGCECIDFHFCGLEACLECWAPAE